MFWLLLGAVWAEPLALEEVLAAAERGAPKLAAARIKLEEQEAKLLGARGAFDPKLALKGEAEPLGYYEHVALDSSLAGQTPLGLGYEVGWRAGLGDWPDYYGAYQTLDGGEVRLALSAPLLRDLGMNPERAEALLAAAGVDLAAAAAEQERQQIAWKAAAAYWKWVAAGEKLALSERQLTLATQRAAWIQRQVDEGGLPQLELLDNQRVVLERQLEVLEAEQALRQATVALSLWYRGDDLAPLVVSPDRLPPVGERPERPELGALEAAAAQAAAARPEAKGMEVLLQQAALDRRLAMNQRLPALDVSGQLSQDFGEGDSALAPLALEVGAEVTWALPARKARGELSGAEFALERLAQERRLLQDAVIAEVRAAGVDVELTWARWQQASLAAEQARQVAELERTRFEMGGSTVFTLNQREEAVAKASKAEIEARLEHRLAEAALNGALGTW